MYRIATNLARDHFRRAGRQQPLDATHEPIAAADDGQDRDVWIQLALVSARDRELLLLAYVEGMTHREIAGVTGLVARASGRCCSGHAGGSPRGCVRRDSRRPCDESLGLSARRRGSPGDRGGAVDAGARGARDGLCIVPRGAAGRVRARGSDPAAPGSDPIRPSSSRARVRPRASPPPPACRACSSRVRSRPRW